jgi:hypothetical protein
MPTLEEFLAHPIENLERALHIRKRIEELHDMLTELMGPTPPSLGGVQINAPKKRGRPRKVNALPDAGSEDGNGLVADGRRKNRTMSPEARARIAAAQRARWAKSKTSHGPLTAVSIPTSESKKKGGMSPEGRARVAAAQKARWAKAKSENPTPTPAKSTSKTKRQLSPEARARIVAAQKKRWAKVKKGQ